MPAALPVIAAVFGGTTAALTTAELLAVTVIRTILVNFIVSKLVNALTGKPASPGPSPVNVSVRSTVDYRRLVFGTARCGGSFVSYFTSGSNNESLWYVIAYAGHQCSALTDAYVDSRLIPTADINRSTGAVATSSFNGKIFIWDHLGTGAQAADAQLSAVAPGTWLTTDTLSGTCYRVIRMDRDDTAWPSGAPQSITSVVNGALLYDPRLDSTNGGSGSHRASDPSTWAFSANSALAVRWYLSGGSVVNDQSSRLIKYGLQETDSRIDDSYTRAAANVCDQSLSGANAPPSGAQVRYAVGIECNCGQTRREIMTELLATMGPGQLAYVHGTWRIYAAAYDAPVHDFTQDDLYGEMSVEDTSSAADRFNAVSATFTDAANAYITGNTIYRTNSSYVTQDAGQSIQKTIVLRGVTDQYRAQRICELTNRSARFMRTVTFKFGRQGMKIAPWETFTFSHARYSWVSRVFRCQTRQLEYQSDGAVLMVITAKQEDSSVYTDLVTADYTTGASSTNAIQFELPEAPTGLTATVYGGQNIRFDWSLGSFWLQNGIVELWEAAHSAAFNTATLIWTGRGTTAIISRNDTTTRDYWVRIRTIGGQYSATDPSGSGVAAAANQVAEGNIANNAVSQMVSSTFARDVSLTAPFTGSPVVNSNIDSLAITGLSGSFPVAIDAYLEFTLNFLAGTSAWSTKFQVVNNTTGSAVGAYWLLDDSKVTWTTGTTYHFSVTLSVVDPSPAAGSNTYIIQYNATATAGGTGGTYWMRGGGIKLREIKK